jgi:hypothetical protein
MHSKHLGDLYFMRRLKRSRAPVKQFLCETQSGTSLLYFALPKKYVALTQSVTSDVRAVEEDPLPEADKSSSIVTGGFVSIPRGNTKDLQETCRHSMTQPFNSS